MKKVVAITLAAIGLAACGELVEVPPATKGIILAEEGYVGDLVPPSKFRLPVCFREPCPQIVLVDVNDTQVEETMDIFLPESNQLLKEVEVRFTASVSNKEADLRRVLDRITPRRDKNGNKVVLFDQIYNTYVQERVRTVVRAELARHSIAWLMANREGFSQSVHQELIENLNSVGSPIDISQFGFAKLNPPALIVKSFEQAEQRKIDLQKAEADKMVKIKEAEARLEIAKKEALVRLEKAKAFVEEAQTYSKVVTPQWLALRELEVRETMAKNKNTIFYPLDMGTSKATDMEIMRNLRDK